MTQIDDSLFEFDESSVEGNVAALTCCNYARAGHWYEAYSRRRNRHHTLSTSSRASSESESDDSDADFDEDNEDFLRTLDPKEWKDQDHYIVLGLSKLRYRATAAQIRNAYKKKVLLHHPDKRKAAGKSVQKDDDYFTNITKAYEMLNNSVTRKAYDSVDPQFDNSIPGEKVAADKFIETFAPVFERNARWSKSKRVPPFGTADSSRDTVDEFYTFWFSFDSWREFSYLDEEDKEKGSDRYERRMIEQDNKRERKERKKEENARIRQLVENAYNADPRIQQFKQDDKEKKAAYKRAKQEAAKAKQEEEERQKKEAERRAQMEKEEQERIAQEKAAAAKKEKEAIKNIQKKERKYFRARLKEFDYFASDPTAKIQNMEEVEKLIEALSIDCLKSLNVQLKQGKTEAEEAFKKEVQALNLKIEAEKRELLGGSSNKGDSSASASGSGKSWSTAEIQHLIKAVNLFPAGTNNRWDVVASYITQHLPTSRRSAKEVLAQAKKLQKDDTLQRKAANDSAFDRAMNSSSTKATASALPRQDDPSQRYMSPAEAIVVETGANPLPWTAAEQKLFEQALRTYPSGTAERWDKIASCLPTRSKKDCMARFKELAEAVKAKKAAAEAAKRK
ncbi:dnaJ homolog subfamily C member 2-like [Watersipora subatra]|uniref:dnaJ homolog subfamily C member 2-like n=1 Tax=Watersipora subatra TaxID=2589382 RepID=UPI00355C70FE